MTQNKGDQIKLLREALEVMLQHSYRYYGHAVHIDHGIGLEQENARQALAATSQPAGEPDEAEIERIADRAALAANSHNDNPWWLEAEGIARNAARTAILEALQPRTIPAPAPADVERVAEALFHHAHKRQSGCDDKGLYEAYSENAKDIWRGSAKAAIAAIRPPLYDKLGDVYVLGLSVQDISRLKHWFENQTGKNVKDFWEEAFNAGAKTAIAAMPQPVREYSLADGIEAMAKRYWYTRISEDEAKYNSWEKTRLDNREWCRDFVRKEYLPWVVEYLEASPINDVEVEEPSLPPQIERKVSYGMWQCEKQLSEADCIALTKGEKTPQECGMVWIEQDKPITDSTDGEGK